jgi:hypothetical protein
LAPAKLKVLHALIFFDFENRIFSQPTKFKEFCGSGNAIEIYDFDAPKIRDFRVLRIPST